MELLEYQAKQLFEQVAIPTLPSQIVADPRDLKQLTIPYPIVLKSQVRAGGRGKAGGIQRVQNTIDAIAAARNIFNLAIAGQYPDVLLAEAHYPREQEIFLAVVLDYSLQRPVLLGSAYGGMEVERLLANLHQVVIEDFFSLFQARHLLNKMGIRGALVPSLSNILEKMYDLLLSKDLDLVEINPLGINQAGEIMALDGKVSAHDTALSKHPEMVAFQAQQQSEIISEPTTAHWHVNGGKIGIVSYGIGAGALIWDRLHKLRGKPSHYWCLGSQAQGRVFAPDELAAQLNNTLVEIQALPLLKVLFLNLLGDEPSNTQVLSTLLPQLCPDEHSSLKIVVRCVPQVETQPFSFSNCHWETDLETGLKQAIAFSRLK